MYGSIPLTRYVPEEDTVQGIGRIKSYSVCLRLEVYNSPKDFQQNHQNIHKSPAFIGEQNDQNQRKPVSMEGLVFIELLFILSGAGCSRKLLASSCFSHYSHTVWQGQRQIMPGQKQVAGRQQSFCLRSSSRGFQLVLKDSPVESNRLDAGGPIQLNEARTARLKEGRKKKQSRLSRHDYIVYKKRIIYLANILRTLHRRRLRQLFSCDPHLYEQIHLGL